MADIKKKILNAATQTHIPTNWSQIFAEACLKAESRLGFELEAKVSGNGHCIWIIVNSISVKNPLPILTSPDLITMRRLSMKTLLLKHKSALEIIGILNDSFQN